MAVVARELDVVVVGAGLSGLVAARLLVAGGASVAVIEARDRVGGRTLSQPLGRGVVDLGGRWLGAADAPVARLADDLGIATVAHPSRGRRLVARAGKLHRCLGRMPLLAPVATLELGVRAAQLDRLVAQISLDDPGAGTAPAWDAITVDDWLRATVRSVAARDVLGAIIEGALGVGPAEASLLCWLAHLRADAHDGDKRCLAGGTQELSVRIAAALGDLRLATPVLAVEQDARGVTVRTARAPLRARWAIVAAPPVACRQIELGEARTAARVAVERAAASGAIITCALHYREPFWRRAGLSGNAIITDGVVRATVDGGSSDDRVAALIAMIAGAPARAWAQRSVEDRRTAVVADLRALFGSAAAQPLAYVEHDWTGEPWGTSPAAVMAPGALARHAVALRTPLGRVHFAGAETATEGMGHLDGAVTAGQRAAGEVLARLRD